MANPEPNHGRLIRFGAYEADVRTGELRKHGLRIKLQDQPFQILVMLLEKPGELVTREEIQQRLWPADTFVDFDHGLNTAIRRMRDALSDSADNPRWIETLPRRGYRFIGQVERLGQNPPFDPAAFVQGVAAGMADEPASTRPVEGDRATAASATTAVHVYRRREAIAGVIIVAITVVGLLAWRFWPHLQPPIASVAVLPFANEGGDPALDYLSEGIAESIMSELAQVPTLRVAPRNSVFTYKGKNVDPRDAARKLNVQAVLLGTVRRMGDNLHITVELVDAENQRQLWSTAFDRAPGEMLVLQREIAQQTSEKLRLRLGTDVEARLARRHVPTPEAYDLYLRGRHALNRRTNDSFRQGLAFFQQAIDADPGYAQAYVGMSAAYGLLAFYGGMASQDAQVKEEASARRALELDPDSAEVHTEMGYMLVLRHRDPVAAEREWKHAIAINPNSADAHHAYSMFLADRGRFDEAIRECRRNEELDPLWPGSSGTTAQTLVYARKYDEALVAAQRAGTGFQPAYFVRGQVYEQQGKYKEAIEAFHQMLALGAAADPSNFGHAMLAHALAVSGQQAEARAILAELLKQRQSAYYSAYNIASVYAGLGDRNSVIAWLKTANQERDPWLHRLGVDPRFDAFRSLPEVQQLQRGVETPD